DVVLGADDGVASIGAVVVVVVGAHAGVGVPISLQPPVAVAVLSGQGDMGQVDAAGGRAGPDGHQQQVLVLDAADGVMLAGQAGQQVGIGLVGLIQVRHRDAAQHDVDHWREAVGLGNRLDDVGQGDVVPAAFSLAGQIPTQISAACPDGEHVRRAAVLNLVDDVAALVGQAGVTPAKPELDAGPARRDGKQAVVVF